MKIYGLATCDTCRKARKALEAAGFDVEFRDLRADPPDSAEWADLLAAFGTELVNRRSTTWRGLSEADRQQDPVTLLAAHPALMKRPVVIDGSAMTCGWDAATRARWGA
ncbi:arsenate reductase family protein [Tropicimonas sp. IMCC34043]|uniref:arsenate reductase family protein n=1 Tax=Tropicimonas sp. IMCC34043 TaxID=2248760 RepID=UPI000E283C69|nr:ArsC/Spx/MgsR family protein [Tropicimonas sp. IMCC34043]